MLEEEDTKNRISPLRGLGPAEIVSQTKVVHNGLSALRDDHFGILNSIRREEKECKDSEMVRMRVENVSRSLERLELGLEESTVILRLHEHFERLEADRSTLRLEMGRVQDENDWLREELATLQAKYAEASLELVDLQEEKKKWEFEEELKKEVSESNVRPVTPSKIPVGSWRVEEEKDINRALNGEKPVEKPASKIPMGNWRSKAGSAYQNLMEKESKKKAAAASGKSGIQPPKKGQYFKLNAARSMSKIPSR